MCYTTQVICRGRRCKRQGLGFSMAELIVAMAMLALGALVVAQAFINMRSSRVYVKAAAEEVAELLRSLRQQAITQGRPVGLGIPTQNGTRTASTGYYVLEGEHYPKVVRRVVMGDDRAVQISGCCWSELAFQASSLGSFSNSSYSLSNWEAPFPDDGLLMFLPSGEVLTNLPTYQGEAALVLGYALQATAGSVGGRPATQLQAAKGPLVVWCSILGEVRLEGGLSGAPQRVSDSALASAVADPPALTSNSNTAPTFVVASGQSSPLQFSPPANPNTLATVAPGNTGTLRKKRYVSLKVTARDADGDALYCTWKADNNSGTFTKQGEVRMHYDPQDKLWVATWAWHPPDGASANAPFHLEATIDDKRGGAVTLSGAISGGGNFRILTPGKLAFTRGPDTWMSNWDGTDPVIVAKGLVHPRWSRGGDLICCSDSSGSLIVVTPDGRWRTKVYNAAGPTSPGSFNHRGDGVVFAKQSGAAIEVRQVEPWQASAGDLWPDPGLLLANFPAGSNPRVDCHPGDDVCLVSKSIDPPGPIVILSNDSSIPARLLPISGTEASYTPNGDIVYRSGPNQFQRIAMPGAAVTVTASLSGGHFPRLSNSQNYAVAQGDDAGKDNCFLFFDGGALSQPRKLFNFPEPCGEPDWAE